MKPIACTILAAALLLGCGDNSGSAPAAKAEGDKTPAPADQTAVKKEVPKPLPDSATLQKNWGDYGTPGEMHKLMAGWDGNWDGEVKMWMDPAAPPQVSQLKTVNKMILNGLFHQSTHTGNMGGMPFSGIGTMGYDNHRKLFVNTWTDNMSSGITYTEGSWDAATQTIETKGKMVDAGTKETIALREVLKLVDKDTQLLQHYHTPDGGQEAKVMEITFKRKK
jgi:hypothetical protein